MQEDTWYDFKQDICTWHKKGIKLIIELSKYIIPSVFVIKILEHSGLLERVSGFMAPYMSYIGLPGEGALVLLFGQVSIYGAIGRCFLWDLLQNKLLSAVQ